MSERPLTLMAVHAHPDDEASGTGGLLARSAAEGVRTVLVTCTDGRCGDGPGGTKPGQPGHDPQAVAALRGAELAKSCELLGVSQLELLGYADSGMMGWPTNDAPGSFWTVPVPVAAERLAAVMRRERPDVVVTYDENGFYGHPDHIQAHRITVAALDRLSADEQPAKVYWTTMPRTTIAELISRMSDEAAASAEQVAGEPDAGGPDAGGPDAGEPPSLGLPDEDITTWVDISGYTDQKFDALSAHESQPDNAFFTALGRQEFARLLGVETFVRVRDTTGTPTPEDDVFSGLRGR
ncbi:PIG-L family deacetylase [Actinacidiphila bryophytorum]|uniref:PIG-L family deacetylase n=1 Tax=Actinacidiphila bryophytorum TaxID=1436133 RepID=UPI00196176C0|nr:PIG-L family deacetylase [Actinacidiphila bryophytorum]MBM9438052.1 PIG-L family deacetylase [Actinacidiphila bryophytorum]MBN6543383.1 PIG-L family deacetylase [Actinacidiphila bryophytorum]